MADIWAVAMAALFIVNLSAVALAEREGRLRRRLEEREQTLLLPQLLRVLDAAPLFRDAGDEVTIHAPVGPMTAETHRTDGDSIVFRPNFIIPEREDEGVYM
jgi:hypothetical protein